MIQFCTMYSLDTIHSHLKWGVLITSLGPVSANRVGSALGAALLLHLHCWFAAVNKQHLILHAHIAPPQHGHTANAGSRCHLRTPIPRGSALGCLPQTAGRFGGTIQRSFREFYRSAAKCCGCSCRQVVAALKAWAQPLLLPISPRPSARHPHLTHAFTQERAAKLPSPHTLQALP